MSRESGGDEARSLWSDAWATLRGNRAAITALWLLVAMALVVVVAPFFLPYSYEQTDWDNIAVGPSLASGHLFGTDSLGRDLLVRTLWGGRISLLVALVSTAVSLAIGVLYGAVAGYVGGRLDQLMMRVVDVLYALPFMFLVILLMVLFGRNIVLIFIAIGAINWLDMARIVRGQTLSLRNREFVEAARAGGVPAGRIIRRHIVPNLLGVVVVYVTLTIPHVILVESVLSFLGLGVQEPMTSWGALVNEGAQELETAWWMIVFPSLFLALTLFCFNFLGDGLRDALDPRDRSRS
ncbi:MAG: peptide ABC transporter permease [Gammaproteobacteria bacterium]|nr:MAG: ABC transporter permease subunit [Pseudomonadota bacterium]MBC6945038.1 ABC transporter permease subunit [Gammaproteobacteria bacterium]MCE7896144.1 ABC transporter permease subunit [Gammaproteobacteria bacterium PRO8]MDL1879751.1 ABC transporter permease subunit [Gammaproteobacteria bacterium PRO2]MCL4776995.1 ABC transporter permease subunit [Gammaproteobacteria bacterium]